MTGISRCLNPRELNIAFPDRCRAYIARQPTTCPHDDCTGLRNCREVCRTYANAQVRFKRNRDARRRYV